MYIGKVSEFIDRNQSVLFHQRIFQKLQIFRIWFFFFWWDWFLINFKILLKVPCFPKTSSNASANLSQATLNLLSPKFAFQNFLAASFESTLEALKLLVKVWPFIKMVVSDKMRMETKLVSFRWCLLRSWIMLPGVKKVTPITLCWEWMEMK